MTNVLSVSCGSNEFLSLFQILIHGRDDVASFLNPGIIQAPPGFTTIIPLKKTTVGGLAITQKLCTNVQIIRIKQPKKAYSAQAVASMGHPMFLEFGASHNLIPALIFVRPGVLDLDDYRFVFPKKIMVLT